MVTLNSHSHLLKKLKKTRVWAMGYPGKENPQNVKTMQRSWVTWAQYAVNYQGGHCGHNRGWEWTRGWERNRGWEQARGATMLPLTLVLLSTL